MAKHRRRTFLIKTGLQLRYMGIIVSTMLLVAFGVGWIIYYTSWSRISDTPDLTIDKLATIFDDVNGLLLKWTVFFAFLIAGLSVFVSHKIAGPVYRFERSARIIASGDLTHRVKLRHGDELFDLQEAFNSMSESLRGMICKNREAISRLIASGTHLSETIKKKKCDPVELENVAQELYAVIEEMRQVTSGFIVDKDLAASRSRVDAGKSGQQADETDDMA
ncbi:MAG: methyl-accepting chemotaxis protein [Candidatus Riflebacteria bacterium]|nr:methyl-accepting chemotaxis protein [Candidatus Riflebacteria bacterium]